jgi:hypothetical protein
MTGEDFDNAGSVHVNPVSMHDLPRDVPAGNHSGNGVPSNNSAASEHQSDVAHLLVSPFAGFIQPEGTR